jgi:PAS domain S-box-containing protein
MAENDEAEKPPGNRRQLRLAEVSRRGRFMAACSRGLASLLCIAWTAMSDDPRSHRTFTLAVVALYVAYAIWMWRRWRRRRPTRGMLVAHDLVDAVGLAAMAAGTGATQSPMWLMFYPHVVGVSVRGGRVYGIAMAALDAGLVYALSFWGPPHPLSSIHPLALLWCAAMAGTASSYLFEVRGALTAANRELADANVLLRETLWANETIRTDQESVLERQRRSEHEYRQLLERMQDGVLIVQEGGRVAYANAIFGSMVGDAPAALIGMDFRELVPEDDRRELTQRYENWNKSQAMSGALETRVLTRKGSPILVSLRVGAVEFEGRPSTITTIRDITRERQMEADLREHAERLAAINEIANALNQNLTVDDSFRVAAQEVRRLVSFDRVTAALLDGGGQEIEVVTIGPARAGRTRLPRAEADWAMKRPVSWTEDGDAENGARVRRLLDDFGVRAAVALPLHSRGRLIGTLNLGRERADPFTSWDVAVMEPVVRHVAIALDNARLFEAVKSRGHELESLLEISRGISGRLDVAELLPLITRSVNRLMGTEHCLMFLRDGDHLVLGAQEGLEPDVLAAVQNLRPGESLTGFVLASGRPLAVYEMRDDPRLLFKEAVEKHGYRSFFCVPLIRGDETLGTLEVVTKQPRRFTPEEQDLMALLADQAAIAIENARLYDQARTSLVQATEANRQLEAQDELRQQYLRNVSHEFRTPLTVLKGYTEYLMQSGMPDERSFREILRILVESSDRLIDMVDTLLEISRVEQGSTTDTLRVQPLEMRDLITGSITDLRTVAERRQIELVLALSAGALTIQGDLGLLQQVVRKLVDNAVKYSRNGGRVEIRARLEESHFVLEVEDLGIGIPAEHLPRIFDKFYTVDSGLTRRAGGAGVGLYLVREIVRLHGGTVAVDSRPEKGSLFSVRLPRDPHGSRSEPVVA